SAHPFGGPSSERQVAAQPPAEFHRQEVAAYSAEDMSTLPHPLRADSSWPPAPHELAPATPTAPQMADGRLPVISRGPAIQQTSASTPTPRTSPNGQSFTITPENVEYAHHQQQSGAVAPIDLLQGASANPSTPAGISPQSMMASKTPSPDPYQEARRQAARMGLGVGSGQMFATLQQTPRAAPGTDSRWNGAEYPAPARSLPTEMQPANLQPAFSAPHATELSPVTGFQGQPLPPVPVPVNQPAQYGAASLHGTQSSPPPAFANPNSPSPQQRYEDVRQQQNRELTGLINETYGQPPQSPPYNAAAPQSQWVNGPSGKPSTTVDFWDDIPMPTVQPDTSAVPQRSNSAAHSIDVSGSPPPRASNLSTVVIPEPYRGSGSGNMAPAPTSGFSSPPQYSGSGQYSGDSSTSFGGPLIVPKSR
ncbi:MAG: hypothetical protein KF861_08895, partial [Planctomycetaceae bacterium]|nr:hypothetical protein [Planctomycetaceae bacterium]